MASTLSSRTFLLNLRFLYTFVSVFIIIWLIVMSCYSLMIDKHSCFLIKAQLSVFFVSWSKPLILLEKTLFQFESCFFRKLFLFFIVFFSHLETSHFYIEVPLIANLIYSHMTTNEQKVQLQGNADIFFVFDSEFSKFLMKFWFSFWDVTIFRDPYGMRSLTKSAIGFLMCIK